MKNIFPISLTLGHMLLMPSTYSGSIFHFMLSPFLHHSESAEKSKRQSNRSFVVPHWPTQPWWPYLANMLIAPPLILPRKKDTLHLPSKPGHLHPLHRIIKLLLCHLSRNTSQARAFQRQLQTLSYEHGSQEH